MFLTIIISFNHLLNHIYTEPVRGFSTIKDLSVFKDHGLYSHFLFGFFVAGCCKWEQFVQKS